MLQLFDILIEFKYISLASAGITGENAKRMSMKEFSGHPKIRSSMDHAMAQLKVYSEILNTRYRNLRLKSFAVISLGFERLCWQKVR